MNMHQMSPRYACSTILLGFHREPVDEDGWPDEDAPRTLKAWKKQFLEAAKEAGRSKNEFYFYYNDSAGVDQLVGEPWTAFGVVYTQTEREHKQTAKFLTKMGFQKAGPFYNEKNDTEFFSWLISVKELRKVFDKIEKGELV